MDLNFHSLSDFDTLAWPEGLVDLSLQSSALSFFTDFSKVRPLVIEASTLAADVKKLMVRAHVNLKIVLNEKNEFVGIVTLEELADRVFVQKKAQGFDRHEFQVHELMIPKRQLFALDYDEVARSTIETVINSLKSRGHHNCLVVERSSHQIRGVFSASDISRKLHMPINIEDKSTFYKVFSES